MIRVTFDRNIPRWMKPLNIRHSSIPLPLMLTGSYRGHGLTTLSRDGRLLASGSSDGSDIGIWNTLGGGLNFTLTGNLGKVRAVAFSPDNMLLASGSNLSELRVWDVHSGQCLHAVDKVSNSDIIDIAFSPDNRLVACMYDQSIWLWDTVLGTCKKVLEGHCGQVNTMAFSSDGLLLLAVGWWDHTVRLWNVGTGAWRKTLYGHSSSIVALALSPASTLMASGSSEAHCSSGISRQGHFACSGALDVNAGG